MTKTSAKVALQVLESFADNSAYKDYKRFDGWTDEQYEQALEELRHIANDQPDPADAKGRVVAYVLNFLSCCTQEMHEAEIIKRGEHNVADQVVNELADAVREVRDRPPPYDPEFGDERECACGHSYYRHFDSHEAMAPVGCKYCACRRFREKTDADEGKDQDRP